MTVLAITTSCSDDAIEPGPVASIEVSPATWSLTWRGARQQFTATARDARGTVVDVAFDWESLDSGIVRVDAAGIATALSPGSVTMEASTPVGDTTISGAAQITVTDPGAAPPGLMYTVWFARSDSAPAVLVNNRLTIPNGFWDEPDATTPWNKPNVAKFQWSGDRIGILSDVVGGVGNFWVRDRVGEWTLLALGNATDFKLSGNLIGVVDDTRSLRVKSGIHGGWTLLVNGGVAQWQLAGGHLIGVVKQNGEFRVKDGIDGPWTVLSVEPVKKFQLGNRIGILKASGEFRVKDGIHGPWTVLASSGAADFQLSGDRIAVLMDDGTFKVKDGANGTWHTLVVGGLKQFALTGNRIAVVKPNGEFRVKDGIQGTWTVLATSGAKEIRLQRNLIGVLTDANVLRIKEGIHGTWRQTAPYTGNVTQFALLVDVPVAPARITPARYSEAVAECAAGLGGVDCYSPLQNAFPVALYGRFCGAGHPEDWGAAVTVGPIDPHDVLCLHHDKATTWYPEAGGVNACVVRYGLHFSRLTNNGVVLATGADDQATWDAAWGSSMPNLKEAVDWYFAYTAGCPLDDFIAATASQN